MIEINHVQIFRPWRAQEFERTIATEFDATSAEKFLERVQKKLPNYQLKPENYYFFEVRKVDVRPIIARQKKERAANLWHTQVMIGILAGMTACNLSLLAHRYFKSQAKIIFFGTTSFSLLRLTNGRIQLVRVSIPITFLEAEKISLLISFSIESKGTAHLPKILIFLKM